MKQTTKGIYARRVRISGGTGRNAPVGRLGVCKTRLLSRRARPLFSQPLSPYVLREVQRRTQILRRYLRLVAEGVTRQRAAARARGSYVTVWRWMHNGIWPQTYRCGRPRLLTKLAVAPSVIRQVKNLQRRRGVGNAKAWKLAARNPRCPQGLAQYVNAGVQVSPSLLGATRIHKPRKA